jgi:hypothetical protein
VTFRSRVSILILWNSHHTFSSWDDVNQSNTSFKTPTLFYWTTSLNFVLCRMPYYSFSVSPVIYSLSPCDKCIWKPDVHPLKAIIVWNALVYNSPMFHCKRVEQNTNAHTKHRHSTQHTTHILHKTHTNSTQHTHTHTHYTTQTHTAQHIHTNTPTPCTEYTTYTPI